MNNIIDENRMYIIITEIRKWLGIEWIDPIIYMQ